MTWGGQTGSVRGHREETVLTAMVDEEPGIRQY